MSNTINNNSISNMELRQLLSSSKLDLSYVFAFSEALKINLKLSYEGEMCYVKDLIYKLELSYSILDEADNKRVFLDSVESEFNAIAKHSLSSPRTYKEILDDVCKYLKIKLPSSNLTYMEQERIIVKRIRDNLEQSFKNNKDGKAKDELLQILKESGIDYKESIDDKRLSDALLGTVGAGALSILLARLVAWQMIRSAGVLVTSRVLVAQFVPVFGTAFALLTATSFLYSLAGVNYKKLIATLILIADLRKMKSSKIA